MSKRQFKEASHIQVRRINRQWCVVSYFNNNFYRPICTGCPACDGSIPALKDWKHSSDSNKRIKFKTADVIQICDTRSEANAEADYHSEFEHFSMELWASAWDFV